VLLIIDSTDSDQSINPAASENSQPFRPVGRSSISSFNDH